MAIETPQTVKGECPECNGERNAYIRANYTKSWHLSEDGASGDDTYNVLECAGCGQIFFQVASSSTYDTEMQFVEELGDWYETVKTIYTHHPPKIIRSKPHWLPKVQARDRTLDRLLNELYASLNIDLSILPAIGARTVFDYASELLGVNSDLTFEKKLDTLVTLGKIGTDERVVLNILVQAGSAAAHRGWSPRATDVSLMMDVAESFLKANFYLRDQANEMGQRVPARNRTRRPAAPATSATPSSTSTPLATPSAPAAPPTPGGSESTT